MDAPKPAHERDDTAGLEADVPHVRMMADSSRDDPDREARWARWREENAGAIRAYNAWFQTDGHRYVRPPLF